MKVLHVITGLDQGGAENVLYRLVTNLPDDIDSMVVSMTDDGIYGSRLEALGIPTTALGMPRGRLTISGLCQLWQLMRQERPDVVQTWMYHADLVGGILARLSGCRRVFWGIVHYNLDAGVTRQSTRLIARMCALFSYLVPERIVSCATTAIQTHIQFGYCARRFTYVPLGFDVEQFRFNVDSRKRIRNKIGQPEAEPLIGCIGRWHAQKDQPNLLQAAKLLFDQGYSARLLLAGAGMSEDNEEIGNLIRNIGISRSSVLLMGQVDSACDILSALDLFVLPSRGEAFPNVLAEAMACRVPCVVTNVGDTAEIVSENGWVVPPGDPVALAEAISAALDKMTSQVLWEELGLQCRKSIEQRYSLPKMVNRYIETWNGLGA